MNLLITGGASGLGEAVVRRLAVDQSHRIYFTYCHSAAAALKLAEEFATVESVKCDFANSVEVEALCSLIAEKDIQVLINNAFSGNFLERHFHKNQPAVFNDTFQRNVMPVIVLTQTAISHFRKKKFGRIITVLTAALVGRPPIGGSNYVAAKAYLGALSRCWAVENAPYGISANTVSPAFMQTAFTADTDERMIELMTEKHPLGRLLECGEAAEAVEFLVNAGNQINGIDLLINAGSEIRS